MLFKLHNQMASYFLKKIDDTINWSTNLQFKSKSYTQWLSSNQISCHLSNQEWRCQFCTVINTMDITVCQVCNNRREAREVSSSTSSSPPQSPKTPVQRQQTDADRRFQKDEKDMTAYEYMQLEEERVCAGLELQILRGTQFQGHSKRAPKATVLKNTIEV